MCQDMLLPDLIWKNWLCSEGANSSLPIKNIAKARPIFIHGKNSVAGQGHVPAVPLSSLSKLSSLVWLQTCFNIIEHFHEVVDNAENLPSISAICDRQFPSLYLKSLGRRPFIQTNNFENKTTV